MMLIKCCRHYDSKFGKLGSGHWTGKGQFSFQSQRKAMSKNIQITIQLHSFHMPTRLCANSFKLGFNSTWTKNFQMYKLDLEKAEEPEIKLPTYVGHRKSKRIAKTNKQTNKHLLHWLCKATNCGIFLKRWEYLTTLPASWETCMQAKKQHLEPYIEQWTGSKLGNEYVKAVYCHPADLTYI